MATTVLRRMWTEAKSIQDLIVNNQIEIVLIVLSVNNKRNTYDWLKVTDGTLLIDASIKKPQTTSLIPKNQIRIKRFSTITAARLLSFVEYELLPELAEIDVEDMLASLPSVVPQLSVTGEAIISGKSETDFRHSQSDFRHSQFTQSRTSQFDKPNPQKLVNQTLVNTSKTISEQQQHQSVPSKHTKRKVTATSQRTGLSRTLKKQAIEAAGGNPESIQQATEVHEEFVPGSPQNSIGPTEASDDKEDSKDESKSLSVQPPLKSFSPVRNPVPRKSTSTSSHDSSIPQKNSDWKRKSGEIPRSNPGSFASKLPHSTKSLNPHNQRPQTLRNSDLKQERHSNGQRKRDVREPQKLNRVGVGVGARPNSGQSPRTSDTIAPPQRIERFESSLKELTAYSKKWEVPIRILNKSDHIPTSDGRGTWILLTIQDKHEMIGEVFVFGNYVNKTEELKVGFHYRVSGLILQQPRRASRDPRVNYWYQMVWGFTTEFKLDPTLFIQEAKPIIRPTSLKELMHAKIDTVTDVVGIVVQFSERKDFQSQKGKPVSKRIIWLYDTSNEKMEITLWGTNAQLSDSHFANEPVAAITRVKVVEYKERRKLDTDFGAVYYFCPDIPIANQLPKWWEKKRLHAKLDDLPKPVIYKVTNIIDIQEVTPTKENQYYSCSGIIHGLLYQEGSRLPIYRACIKCNRKVTPSESDGQGYDCHKCDMTYFEHTWRYLLRVQISDATGNLEDVTVFDNIAKTILGCEAATLGDLEDQLNQEQNPDSKGRLFEKLESIFKKACYQHKQCKLIVNLTYDERRNFDVIKYRLEGFEELDYVKQSERILEEIEKLSENTKELFL